MLNSFIELESEQVRKICVYTLEVISSSRQEMVGNFIEETVEKINNSFFRRLFKMKKIKHQDVASWNENDLTTSVWLDLWHKKHAYEKNEEVALRLLNMSKLSNKVYVSAEDMSLLVQPEVTAGDRC